MDKVFLVVFPKKTLNLANCPPCASQYGPIPQKFFQSLIIGLKIHSVQQCIISTYTISNYSFLSILEVPEPGYKLGRGREIP